MPPPESSTVPVPSGPLAGLLVADFSRVLAGPYATMLLADLGAEVIKVEGPGGDDTRGWVPPTRDGVGTYYLAVNRNKRSVALDLKDEGDRALAHELSARADVFIQNFKPGGLARYGLDYDAVRDRNQSVIYCSISGFGASKGARLPGYDLLVQGMSGLMSLTGTPDGPPLRSGISVFDVMTGLHSVIGILAALHHRDRTGEGQHIEANLLSSALSALVNQTSAYVAGGVVPTRMGNAHLSLFPYEPLQTGDGELIVVAGNDGQFRRLTAAIGRPELADDDRFDTVGKRNDNRAQLRPLLLDALAAKSAQDWFGI
jgi:crotonobetainyl-CoA:carnitine CoA-transferase CaiB-like acyl-CoA transferase